ASRGNTVCRLLSARNLQPETRYHAFLVPTFKIGAEAAMGITNGVEDRMLLSWTSPADGAGKILPYFYDWEFGTGTKGSWGEWYRFSIVMWSVLSGDWDNKVDNIRYIQSVLNIGFDSLVFLDDNPFERNMVREHLPDVTVPELPEDPAEYLEFLYTQNLFETASYVTADQDRTEQYQVEAKRTAAQKSYTDESSFLGSLEMVSDVQPFNSFNTPRVAQLSQRSNQFNLRTVRYTDGDIERLGNDENYATFSFTLQDKFGDNGLICVVILQKENSDVLFIDTWFMSCRVLKRGMEQFVLNALVEYAQANGYKQLKGQYIATPKNDMVSGHYQKLGFSEQDGYWYLDLATYQTKECFIATKNTVVK
ncbi:MAG: hypothetical protein EOP51_20320, partial [Sphingobacteriales bacterium]